MSKIKTNLEFTINREVKRQSPEVEREQMALRVVQAGVRGAEAVLYLLDRWRYLGRVETHAAGGKEVGLIIHKVF